MRPQFFWVPHRRILFIFSARKPELLEFRGIRAFKKKTAEREDIQVAPPVLFGYHIGGYYSHSARASQNCSSFEAFAPSTKTAAREEIQVAPPVLRGCHIGGSYSYLARESQNCSSCEAFAPSKKKEGRIHVRKGKRDITIILTNK